MKYEELQLVIDVPEVETDALGGGALDGGRYTSISPARTRSALGPTRRAARFLDPSAQLWPLCLLERVGGHARAKPLLAAIQGGALAIPIRLSRPAL